MRSREALAVWALVLAGCGAAPAPVAHLRDANAAERVAVLGAVASEGQGAELVDARAVGADARVVAVFAARGTFPPMDARACAAPPSASDPVVDPSAEGCATVVLARWSRSLDAIDARVTLGAVCSPAGTPPIRAVDVESGDLDGDGRLELALTYDALPAPSRAPMRFVRVVDLDTFAVQLATQVDILDGGTPGHLFAFQADDRAGTDLVVATYDFLAGGEELLRPLRRPARTIVRIGPRQDAYDFSDSDPQFVTNVPYDAANDCWPYRP